MLIEGAGDEQHDAQSQEHLTEVFVKSLKASRSPHNPGDWFENFHSSWIQRSKYRKEPACRHVEWLQPAPGLAIKRCSGVSRIGSLLWISKWEARREGSQRWYSGLNENISNLVSPKMPPIFNRESFQLSMWDFPRISPVSLLPG